VRSKACGLLLFVFVCRFILMGQYVMSSMTWLVLYLVLRDPGILGRERLDGKTQHQTREGHEHWLIQQIVYMPPLCRQATPPVFRTMCPLYPGVCADPSSVPSLCLCVRAVDFVYAMSCVLLRNILVAYK
jgi:hypothetical protein